MKLCPFCAEEIQDAAIKCKHCGAMLARFGPEVEWYYKPGMLLVAFLVVGPFMLPLLWWSPHLNRRYKLVWTGVVLVISLLLVWAAVRAIATLIEYYKMLAAP